MIPVIPPSEVKMMECHSSFSFMKMMANDETPIPANSKTSMLSTAVIA
jgi:hypothetical protein